MTKIAHDPADGWTAIASETGWPNLESPLPIKRTGLDAARYLAMQAVTDSQIAAGIEVYRTYQDQVFPKYEDVVRDIYLAMQAAK